MKTHKGTIILDGGTSVITARLNEKMFYTKDNGVQIAIPAKIILRAYALFELIAKKQNIDFKEWQDSVLTSN